jgi:hypothetical protein
MPDYKKRRIELTPKQERDGRWQCTYRVIEFKSTSWEYWTGHSDGLFASPEAATAAALKDAKCIVDALEFPTYNSGSQRSTVLGMCEYGLRKLFASFQ